jgi:hypothetical protein
MDEAVTLVHIACGLHNLEHASERVSGRAGMLQQVSTRV